jgi:hypothetical protein
MHNTDAQHSCNDLYAIHGVVFHCDRYPGHDGDHLNTRGGVGWPQHSDTGARWVIRHPGAWLWHRIQTSKRTACGLDIAGLTLSTLRGRTLAKPPAGGLVCPACLSMAPWVTAANETGAVIPAA